MFYLNFSFTIFSLMFFSLFWKVFIDILKIYALSKVQNKIPNIFRYFILYFKKHLFYLTMIIYQANSVPPTAPDFFIIPLLTLLKMCPRAQGTFLIINFRKIIGRTYFLNILPKEHFFVASDVVTILSNKPCIYWR